MRLLLIEGDKPWRVLAIEDEEGESVWTWLLGEGTNKQTRRHARKMRYLMREQVPRYGPPQNRNQGTRLKDTAGILELKTGPKRGTKLRVMYFFDGERQIVCTHGFWKSDAADTSRHIRRAEELKREYLSASKRTLRKLPPHKEVI